MTYNPTAPYAPNTIDDPAYRHAQNVNGTNTLGASPTSGGNVTSQQYDALLAQLNKKIEDINAGLIASTGYDKWALEQQYADAQKGRDNAIALERMRDKTSRYGIDQQSATAMRDLEERARQFDQNHNVEIQKLGLDRAKTEVDYLSSPDRALQANQYLNLSGRVLSGQPGAAPGNVSGTPTPNTEAGFAALQAGGNPAAASGAGTDTSPAGIAARAAGSGAGADDRAKALMAVIKASPPSDQPGLNNNDNAVLAAARAMYSTNLNPQQFAALKSDPGVLGINRSAGKMLGYDTGQWEAQQTRNGIGQQSVRAA